MKGVKGLHMANYRQALIDKINCDIKQSEVVAGKIKTSYLIAGQGFPVILLHGVGAGTVTWYPSIEAISKLDSTYKCNFSSSA